MSRYWRAVVTKVCERVRLRRTSKRMVRSCGSSDGGALVDGVVHLLSPDVEGVGLGVAFAAEEADFAEGFLCVHGYLFLLG